MATKPKRRKSKAASAAPKNTAEGNRHAKSPNPAPPEREFFNRELSWLEFNRRVLHEAVDSRTPLLERVKFLSIFTSNLDEFFMKRVGGLKRQVAEGVVTRSADGLTPAQQLAAIRQAVKPMLGEQARAYRDDILPALAEQNIFPRCWDELTKAQKAQAQEYFRARVFPILTPLAVDPGHPFPFMSNLSTSLGVLLRHPRREEKLFARVKVPDEVLPPWIELTSTRNAHEFISLIDLIQHNLDDLFPDMVLLDVMPFRITRNADIERDEEDADDLLELIEQEVRQRRFEKAVRLEHAPKPNKWMLRFLVRELGLAEDDVYEMPAELDYTALRPIGDLNVPSLRYEPWLPAVPPALADEDSDLFSILRTQDLLVHHPYESFAASVERFIAAAAVDPNVLAIKMTLYRTGADSIFIPALIRAAEAGKQVVCMVELKARFDEERNILWAQALEKAGVHVVYGIVGLKTHTKTTLVVRKDADALRCYAHIGTGNYHSVTAKLYTDLSLLTCKPAFTDDIVELFHYITGRSLKREYRKLLVAPVNMKERFLGMIEREIAHQAAGGLAHIVAKMNSLEDVDICRALYRASQAGVEIDLIVRGFCCLVPGLPGWSDRIRVTSVIGRFLEHSRIFYFRNGAKDPADGEFYIGSADWMYRNLQARVEAVTPIEPAPLRARCWQILRLLLTDHRQAWDLQPDGTYIQRTPDKDTPTHEALGTHQQLMNLTRTRET
ncbi:MAG: polyphosphate kinase 1 [Phycisphaerae bacterium]|nr:polyphosphate kinase 1 [Phycisphaerae bacterium]